MEGSQRIVQVQPNEVHSSNVASQLKEVGSRCEGQANNVEIIRKVVIPQLNIINSQDIIMDPITYGRYNTRWKQRARNINI